MSLHAYMVSLAIAREDPPFYSLIMAAMRKADTSNLDKLRVAWPDIWRELDARYNAPLGMIEGDREDPFKVAMSTVAIDGTVRTRWLCAVCQEDNEPEDISCKGCDTVRGGG